MLFSSTFSWTFDLSSLPLGHKALANIIPRSAKRKRSKKQKKNQTAAAPCASTNDSRDGLDPETSTTRHIVLSESSSIVTRYSTAPLEDLASKQGDEDTQNADEISVSSLHIDRTEPASHIECAVQDRQYVSLREYDVLRYYHQNTPDIILHSSEPDISPHIVISACEDSWNSMVTASLNRLNPQCPDRLMVPYIVPAWGPVEEDTLGDMIASEDTCELEKPSEPASSLSFPAPVQIHAIGNHQELSIRVKQRYRHCAYEASGVARMHRQRYDFALDAFSHLETPFVWTDPAEPILLQSKHYHSTLVLDSLNPFKVPHIIISGAEVQHPWYSECSRPPFPQDPTYLCVPSLGYWQPQPEEDPTHYTSVMEDESQWGTPYEEDYQHPPGDDYLFEDDEQPEDVVVSLRAPRPDSPTPSLSSWGTLFQDAAHDSDDTLSSFDEDESSSGLDTPVYSTGELPWNPRFRIDEDDDELPPLDVEWCVRAERMNLLA